MADDTKPEAPAVAEPKPAAKRRPESKPEQAAESPSGVRTLNLAAGEAVKASPWVLFDVVGPDDVAPHAQAPIVMSKSGHVDLVLHPGFNRVSAQTWAGYEKHAGVVARLPAPDANPGPLAGDILPIAEIPRRAPMLVDLIARTYSVAGLDVLDQFEREVTSGKPRGIVAAALVKQHAVMAKRAKPVKVEAVAKPKRRAR